MNLLRRAVTAIVTFSLLVGFTTATGSGQVLAAGNQVIDINIAQDDLLDVVLTLGNTDSDVSSFDGDLTDALVDLGVPEENIAIQSIQSNDVSAGNTTSGWYVYDHYGNFREQSYPGADSIYSGTNHIIVKKGGDQITFYGYGDYPFVDLMYMPNTDSTKKTFTFTMDDNNVNNHSMFGGGFVFNAQITNLDKYQNQTLTKNSTVTDAALNQQYFTGYLMMMYKTSSGSYPILYKINNVSMQNFHDSTNVNDFMNPSNPGAGVTVLKLFSSNILKGTHSITMEVSGDTVTMADTVGTVTKTLSYTDSGLMNTGSFGFGPVGIYKTAGHSCSMLSWFNFENLQMTTTSARKFSEVIREPNWRDESKRFVINAQDGAEADFSDNDALGEIIARLANENIDYIGWGRDDQDGNSFIAKNNNGGYFVDKDAATTDTYYEQIEAMAQYIYDQYINSVVNDTEHLLYGKPSSLSITPETVQTNTSDVQWPVGKWLIDHDPDYYENPTGTVPYDNIRLNNLDVSFTQTGKYDIYYMDEIVKTVYVHRKPEAGFAVTLDDNNKVTLSDNSYDWDALFTADRGIKAVAWSYREASSAIWITGKPTTLADETNYIIKQVVSDEYGVTSDPYCRFVSTKSQLTLNPMAEFSVTPTRLLRYNNQNTIAYQDTSYDPQGGTISEKLWTVEAGSTKIYQGATPMTDFSSQGTGEYKISLEVKNSAGIWSQPVARFVTIVDDKVAPTATVDTASGSYTDPQVITLNFLDEPNGSGFSHRFAVVTGTTATPTNWGSMGTNSSYSLLIGQPGTYYVHYQAYDYAGNEKVGYFGPFYLIDNEAPTMPTLTAGPKGYQSGAWTNQAVTVTASGSTDNFTAAADLIYQVSTDGTDFANGSTIEFSEDGTYNVYFRTVDQSGNISAIATYIVNKDAVAPTMPEITLVSQETTYQAGTWANAEVDVTIGKALDATSGIAKYQYQIDDGAWVDSATLSFFESGEYSLAYRSVDQAGNISLVGTKAIKID